MQHDPVGEMVESSDGKPFSGLPVCWVVCLGFYFVSFCLLALFCCYGVASLV